MERKGQKAIIIGKQGAKLKEIGTTARLDLEKVFNCKVFWDYGSRLKPAGRMMRVLLGG